jgi:hypothetical protein
LLVETRVSHIRLFRPDQRMPEFVFSLSKSANVQDLH